MLAVFLDCMLEEGYFCSTDVFLCLLQGKFSPWHLSKIAWPSPLVKLLYNRYQRQKSPSCGMQLGDWFIPHEYYRQIWNTRKQRTQQVSKSYEINTKAQESTTRTRYYIRRSVRVQKWQNSTISALIPPWFLRSKMLFPTTFLQDNIYHR